MNIYNNRINILLKIFYKIICSFFSIITLLSESFLDIRSTKENRRIKRQSTIRDRTRKNYTAIRLFEMIQKGITVIFVQLCVLLYSLSRLSSNSILKLYKLSNLIIVLWLVLATRLWTSTTSAISLSLYWLRPCGNWVLLKGPSDLQ